MSSSVELAKRESTEFDEFPKFGIGRKGLSVLGASGSSLSEYAGDVSIAMGDGGGTLISMGISDSHSLTVVKFACACCHLWLGWALVYGMPSYQ